MHKARWRERRAPRWERRWEERKGHREGHAPRGSHCRRLHFCGHGGFVHSWLSSQRSRAEARPERPTRLTRQSAQGCLCLFLPAHFLIRLGDPCTSLGGGKGGTVYSLVG